MQNFVEVLHFSFSATMETEMACEGKAYSGICENKLAFIRKELRALGLTMPDDHEGRIHSSDIGVEAEFRYTIHIEELWIKVNEKPFFIPCSYIFARLENAIANYAGPGSMDMGPDPF
jgi:hypothetical protein